MSFGDEQVRVQVKFELRTPRLVLRPLSAADTLELHALWTSAGVRRFLWDDETIALEKTRDVITNSEHLFRSRGLGLWAGRHQHSNVLTAFTGFWHFRNSADLELLYGVAEASWGHGFGVEAARAVVAYGFGTLGMQTIRASTDEGNVASIRVLEKLDFRVTDRRVVKGLATVFFERSAGL